MGKSTKTLLKIGATAGYNPIKGTKQSAAHIKEQGQKLKPPEAPEATEAEKSLEARQREELARLDEQENIRLKRGMRGRLGNRLLSSRPAGSARSSTTGGNPAQSPTVRVPRQPGGRSAY